MPKYGNYSQRDETERRKKVEELDETFKRDLPVGTGVKKNSDEMLQKGFRRIDPKSIPKAVQESDADKYAEPGRRAKPWLKGYRAKHGGK
jgi:hypothetical protein